MQTGVTPDRLHMVAQLFTSPRIQLAPISYDELDRCLCDIDRYVAEGYFAAGYFSFEAGYALEPRLRALRPHDGAPLARIGIYETPTQLFLPLEGGGEAINATSPAFGLTLPEYSVKVSQIFEWIAAGDVYQINLTDAFQFECGMRPNEVFRNLCTCHPVENAAFINLGATQILSISPELFFESDGTSITVKPMKGTAPRGKTSAEDAILSFLLSESEKNRAENLMIVDLLRNDLGRISRAGSVEVTSLFAVEKYASLFQMTSTVTAELKPGTSCSDIVRALFPCGSVTGAPKIRAMELIHQLERGPRGVYTGSIGYFGPAGSRFNVAIRTLELTGTKARLGAGSGIVWDSVAEEEWQECRTKASFVNASGGKFQIIETMRWDGTFHHLEEHLERMRDSADYFGFNFNVGELRTRLRALLTSPSQPPAKVRVLLYRGGELEIASEPLSPISKDRVGRVAISHQRTSSEDRYLFHKTTNRRIYDEEIKAARATGLDDVLFFNEGDELTEGCIHNVFLQFEDKLLTPPLHCGLLPGIERSFLLKHHPGACERVLGRGDLFRADKIFLCNSVKGLYEVRVEDR